MKPRILLIGEDPVLLETRAFLLSEWETAIKNTRSAIPAIQAERFDVVILGQLVKTRDAELMVAAARQQEPSPEVLVIRRAGESTPEGVETHEIDLCESPAWLKEWVRSALEKRSGRLTERRIDHRTHNLH